MTHLQKLAMHRSAHPAAALLPPAQFTMERAQGERYIWRIIPFAGALTLLALAWLSLMALQSYRAVTEEAPTLSRLEEIWAQILFFDQSLSMSAQAAAASSDPKWDVQYRRSAAQLVRNVNRAAVTATARLPGWRSAGTDAATDAVMAMEDHATFAAGVAQFSRSLKQAIDAEKWRLQARVQRTLSVAVLLGPILILGWSSVLLAVRGWRVAVRRSNQQRNEQISALLGRYRRALHAG